jgi:RNA-directed DNA polymerase
VVLYIERWLKAPAIDDQGNLLKRERGTPQGGVISPLLANLFLHYAFDLWMRRNWKHLPFERYADDIIIHCRAKWEVELVRAGITARLKECGLELHPEKTKLVYCKDANRQQSHPNEQFDFLGYTFRPRAAVNRKGQLFCSFSPGISKKAILKISDEIRRWKLHQRTAQSIEDLARLVNPKLRGWFNYYGRFNPSALRPSRGMSANRWFAGLVGNTRNFAGFECVHGTG